MSSSPTGDMLSALVVGREEPGFSRAFGKYELLERVGAGGMAEVFRAVVRGAEGFEKEVCIKRILPMFTEDEDFVRMFIDEAALASKLHHANIVQTLDFDKIEGQYYIALEFVEGRDLKRVMSALKQSGRPMPIGIAAFIGGEILKGLHFAHARRHSGQALGVIHRDISPHNVLVSMSGEVKITDFGIAKAASRASATKSGVVKGKILYMSPEQAGGGLVDHRADLFAAGVVLYEIITGARPFLGPTDAESLAKISRGVFTPARALRPDISERLDGVVSKLLARVPSERYSSGADALRDLGPEVPADGAMQLGELMSALLEGPVPIARRVVTQVIDADKPRAVVFEPAVVPADSRAVTRTRGPREEPGAIAFLDTQIAATTGPDQDAPSLGSEILPSVPTVISGPPDMVDRGTIPPTASHEHVVARAAALGTGSHTAPETPRGKVPAADTPAPTEATPAAWSFSAETSRPVEAPSSRAPFVALAASVILVLCAGAYWLTRADTFGGPPAVAPVQPLAQGLPPMMPTGPSHPAPPPVLAASPSVDSPPAPTAPTAPPPPSVATVPPALDSPRSPPSGAATPSPSVAAQPSAAASPAAASPAPATRTHRATAFPAGKSTRDRAAPRTSARPAPAIPTEPAFGSVIINAQPWARVKVNGRLMGETPVGPVRVPAGTVRVVFEREGRAPLTRTITVGAGEERSLSVPFP